MLYETEFGDFIPSAEGLVDGNWRLGEMNAEEHQAVSEREISEEQKRRPENPVERLPSPHRQRPEQRPVGEKRRKRHEAENGEEERGPNRVPAVISQRT